MPLKVSISKEKPLLSLEQRQDWGGALVLLDEQCLTIVSWPLGICELRKQYLIVCLLARFVREIAEQLAGLGANVILACRNTDAARDIASDIRCRHCNLQSVSG